MALTLGFGANTAQAVTTSPDGRGYGNEFGTNSITVGEGLDSGRMLSLDAQNILISPMEREKFVSEQSELTNLREGIDNLATNVENTLSRNSKFINSLRISALSPTERGTSDSRVLSLDAPNNLRHSEFISASNNSNILTGTENQINVTSNNGLILKQVQDDEKYRNDMGTPTGFAAEGIYSLPSGENTDVSKLVYSAAVSEGSDNYSSLRVNPSPENLALADDAQADFLSSPEGRGQGYGVSTDFNDNLDFNSETETTYNNKAIWVKPYTSFERINLHNGPKVDMISYGTLFGGDSDFRKLKGGWSNVGTLYLGYNGASMDYSGVSSTFNGGVLGITESFYKKNFFTAISANVGAGFNEAHTMYGHDDMTMLMAGVASKTGYNFEFKEGRFIIQPSLLLSYSMINTFDYRNSAGVKIDSDPLHTIQLNPNVKFIANLKHGWQPYASVGMVYNLMNETKVTANNVKLPETSTRPYVEYGIGVQKHFKETFSGYGQAMVRNGGRNGIALTLGFRWALGGRKLKKITRM